MAKNDKNKKNKPNAAEKSTKKGKGGPDEQTGLSIAAHPRARVYVRRAKGWGGLLGFAIAAYLSLKASVPIVDAGERALLFGAVGYLVAWGVSVAVWRQFLTAELRVRAEQIRERRADEAAAAEAGLIKPSP